MQIRALRFTREQLNCIPRPERSLLVVVGHALNEVNAVNRLLAIAARVDSSAAWATHASVFQAVVLAKILVGKLHETWKVVTKGYQGQKLGLIFDALLSAEAVGALSELKRYFGRKNLIAEVRNSFAFHYDLGHAGIEIPEAVSPEELCVYLHQHNGNCLYQFAESTMGIALLAGISPNAPDEALGKLLDEISEVVAWLNEFGQGLMIAILERHILRQGAMLQESSIDIGTQPAIDSLRLPLFVEMPDRHVEGDA